METTKQSVDSDIEIRVTLRNSTGDILDTSLGRVDFEVKATDAAVFSGNSGQTPKNCYHDGDVMVITIPSNTFKATRPMPLYIRIKTIAPNSNFSDGTKDVWGSWIKTNLQVY